MSENNIALELRNVTKRFGTIVANNNVSMNVMQGEILAILGENGSGKTSLMNVIAGIYYPEEGEIFVKGESVQIHSPKEAYQYHIGMIHQHYKLVDVFTATENVVLGLSASEYQEIMGSASKKLNLQEAANKIKEIADSFGFQFEPNKKVYSMSVSEKQTLEILKVLFRGAELLILDEPTAVLTPQETRQLFKVLKNMRKAGKSIIIITHKLNEVMEISDRVTVLRKGQYIDTVLTKDTNENALTEMMVGKKIDLNIDRTTPKNPKPRLLVNGLTINDGEKKILDNITLEAKSGEILGIAGIAGSGQRELLEAIAGLQKYNAGEISYVDFNSSTPVNLKELSPANIRELGIRLSFVPEDRLGMGLVGTFDLVDNVMLRSYTKNTNHHYITTDRKTPSDLTNKIVSELEVVTPNVHTEIRKLSGGNVQKVLVGREIASSPTVLMAAYPVRGLDINSSYLIYNLLNAQKENGAAVVFVGEDLDVLIALCDRIAVLCGGRLTGVVDARHVTKDQIGTLMTQSESLKEEN
ncbi:MAG: ABC transporter ATP-binding protein [Bacilli bacterium]|nr:ABC transporter ATP-binding protein [Bacilli bacterium]